MAKTLVQLKRELKATREKLKMAEKVYQKASDRADDLDLKVEGLDEKCESLMDDISEFKERRKMDPVLVAARTLKRYKYKAANKNVSLVVGWALSQLLKN